MYQVVDTGSLVSVVVISASADELSVTKPVGAARVLLVNVVHVVHTSSSLLLALPSSSLPCSVGSAKWVASVG